MGTEFKDFTTLINFGDIFVFYKAYTAYFVYYDPRSKWPTHDQSQAIGCFADASILY